MTYGSCQRMWESNVHAYLKPSASARWVSSTTRRCGGSVWNVTPKSISGSPRDVAPERPAAGAARRGRRPAGIPLGFQGSRTTHGGDRRSPITGGTLREGPLGCTSRPKGHRSPMARWTDFVIAHRRRILAIWFVLFVFGGFAAANLGGLLSNRFSVPGAESERGLELLQQRMGDRSDGAFTLVATGVDRPAERAAVEQAARRGATAGP